MAHTIDIGFKPQASDIYSNSTSGFFDGIFGGGSTDTVVGGSSGFDMGSWGLPLIVGGGLLDLYGQGQAIKAQTSNVLANVRRTESNIAQIRETLTDSLTIQARKVSRREGTQVARIGASGVGFSGSPLMILAETYKRGMEDYEAIEERGRYAIDSAYQNIYDSLDRAVDAANAAKTQAITTVVKTGATIAML